MARIQDHSEKSRKVSDQAFRTVAEKGLRTNPPPEHLKNKPSQPKVETPVVSPNPLAQLQNEQFDDHRNQ